MTSTGFSFGNFSLDAANRQLLRDGHALVLNGRYLDALTLLVSEAGQLVTKDRFMDEVWGGVPVTDEALTQCIRTLRRLLGDDAARPLFIQTVPKHGYRFIAAVREAGESAVAPTRAASWHDRLRLWAAGTAGGGLAGLIGGLFYGFAAAAVPANSGVGAASTIAVILVVTTAMALLGAAGVSGGIAAFASATARPTEKSIFGGALGGLMVGGLAHVLGLDAFSLLVGRAPDGITGPFEGMLLGAAVGLGAWLASRPDSGLAVRHGAIVAAAIVAGAGLLIAVLGGQMMAGSLDLLAREFPSSRLRLDVIGHFVGESNFGPISRAVTGSLEGALFGGCIVTAMVLAQRRGSRA
jgi:DNA-binding winged helix-turn-helix (wHTH) protein